jgi:CRP/FNR family transcriptional regulator, cyclic AMP receptor protein
VPLSRAATTEILAGVPLFARCSKRDLGEIARLTQEVSLPAGHTVVQEDAQAFSFFVLVDGAAEVRRQGRVVGTLAPGEFFGEMALVMKQPRLATVTLTAPSRLLSIGAHNFQPLLLRSPDVQLKVLTALADRLATLTE